MNRSGFLATTATLAAGTTAIASAQTVPGGMQVVERKANFDEAGFAAAVDRHSQIRQVWEAVAFKPALWNNVKNAMNGLQFGFGYPEGSFIVAFAGHGPSAAYGFSDYVWSKYRIGAFQNLTDAAGAPVTSNVYLGSTASPGGPSDPDDPKSMYQDTSIATLQQRGLLVLTCHTAVEEQARGIVSKGFAPAGMTAREVAADILTHLIPGAIVVPSMVATVAVLQAKYRYTYITLS